MKTIIQYEEDKKELAMENIYIASIATADSKTFRIQSADVSGVQPHQYIRQEHPDIFRNSFIVVKDFEKDPGVEGFPLEAGHYIKIGRVEYLVIEVMDASGSKTLKQTSHLEINKGTHTAGEELVGSCKVCLCEEQTVQDPLINPCSCKGSCALIHAGCLRNWINSKVKRELNGIAISYNFSKFECEICRDMLPRAVRLTDGTHVDLVFFEKPKRPYIVLESMTDIKESKQRLLYVIFPRHTSQLLRVGRGNDCEIKISDISISRMHAEIFFQEQFFIRDLQSKFGTLVKFRESVEFQGKIQLQYGRACLSFDFHMEIRTPREET